jgi:hypothetical protein
MHSSGPDIFDSAASLNEFGIQPRKWSLISIELPDIANRGSHDLVVLLRGFESFLRSSVSQHCAIAPGSRQQRRGDE